MGNAHAYSTFIFDLDGTVLDTLGDLVALTNVVMEHFGHAPYSREKVLSFVGNGAEVLLRRAFAPIRDEALIADAYALWQQLYPEYGHKYTQPYPGMPETLVELKRRGCKLGVLSNKFDAAAREVIARHYPDVFDAVRGEAPDIPRKPDPQGLANMIKQLGSAPETVAYVGDSGATDMAVAVACGVFPIGVTWGYQETEKLLAHGAKVLIDRPQDLLEYVPEVPLTGSSL